MLRVVCLAAALGSIGCGKNHGPALATARESLQAALDGWKASAPPADLIARTPPIEFTDEDRKAGHVLLDYTIAKVEPYGDVIHCTTDLSVKDRKGKIISRKVVYAVALRDKIVIGRDPYF